VFGIGTADACVNPGTPQGTQVSRQPKSNVQCLGELCFSWYGLAEGDRRYSPLPVQLTLGPDLARSLHPVWEAIEAHAEPLDRLCRQQAGVSFVCTHGLKGPALTVNFVLAEPNEKLRLVLEKKEVRFYLHRQEDIIEVDPKADSVERGIYLILAELAG
jgi:hypothetical protein